MDLIGGRWELLEPIASGGTSTVWRAHDHTLKMDCAAKVLRQRDAGEILRFAREQSLRLVGDHVVAPYAWAADDGTALIAFELVTGGSLGALIGDYGAICDGTVATILDQLLDALDDVHEAGIVHRDVKPGNVLLRATGSGPLDVALTDFGIAIAVSDPRLTVAGTVIGTRGYMPPEVVRGHAEPDPAHDLYALGCLATALVLGREDGRPEDALATISDPALAEAVRRLTETDPARRPASVAETRALLADAVREAVPRDREGEPISVLEHVAADDEGQTRALTAAAPFTAAAPPESGRPLRRRLAVIGISLVAVAAVAGIAVAVWLDGRAAETSSERPQESVDRSEVVQAPEGEAPAVGDECTWLNEGDIVMNADGVEIECRRIDGAYVWEAGPGG